jgi:hypothetical protein
LDFNLSLNSREAIDIESERYAAKSVWYAACRSNPKTDLDFAKGGSPMPKAYACIWSNESAAEMWKMKKLDIKKLTAAFNNA